MLRNTDLSWKPTHAYDFNLINKDIYFLNKFPDEEELHHYINSYVIIHNEITDILVNPFPGTIYYIFQDNESQEIKAQPLNLDKYKVTQLNNKISAKLNAYTINYTINCNFYLLEKRPSYDQTFIGYINELTKKLSNEPRSGIHPRARFILVEVGKKLYLIDRIKEKVSTIKYDVAAFNNIKSKNESEEYEFDNQMVTTFPPILDDTLEDIAHLENIYEILKNDNTPINYKITDQFIIKIKNLIHKDEKHANGIYNIYEGYVGDIQNKYQDKDANFISGNFPVPSEENDESLEETVNKTVLNTEWMNDQKKTIEENYTHNAAWWADILSDIGAAVVEYVVNNIHHSHGHLSKGGGNDNIYNQLKTVYDKEIKMREGKTFRLDAEIYMPEHPSKYNVLKSIYQQGNFVGMELTLHRLPNFAEVWIVANVNPMRLVENKCLRGNSDYNAFVCFSQRDAQKLTTAIQKAYLDNLSLIELKLLKIKDKQQHVYTSYIINNVTTNYINLMANFEILFKTYLAKAKEYAEYKGSNVENFIAFNAIQEIYQDLRQLKQALTKILDVINIHSNTKEMADIYGLINEFNAKLKHYIHTHPYLDYKNSLVHQLLYTFKVIQEQIPEKLFRIEKQMIIKNNWVNGLKDTQLTQLKNIILNQDTGDKLVNFCMQKLTMLQQTRLYAIINPLQQAYLEKILLETIYKRCQELKTNTIDLRLLEKTLGFNSIDELEDFVSSNMNNKDFYDDKKMKIKLCANLFIEKNYSLFKSVNKNRDGNLEKDIHHINKNNGKKQ